MSQEIRILLVDDHSLFRESLSRLLEAEPGFRIVGSCGTAAEALALLNRESADIVLLDYDLGEEQGSIFLEKSKGMEFEGRVLMVTAGMDDSQSLRAMENGSSGIFLKHSPPADLVQAIRRIVGGEMWLDPGAVRAVVAGATGRASSQPEIEALSARERSVLKAVFEGFTNKEIASQLGISESSVKAAMQQLFDKTGVRTRSQLVRIALERYTQELANS
ncbi:MAG: response regulator [Bryobacteraceae bacterium]